MSVSITELDAHEQPSERLRAIWKAFSRADQNALLIGDDIDDPTQSHQVAKFRLASEISAQTLSKACSDLLQEEYKGDLKNVPVYYHPLCPGLLIAPSLVPPDIQKQLLSRMIHRDLSNPHHQTNLHLHYELPYPSSQQQRSFFSHPPDSPLRFTPKDPAVHNPLSMKQVMERKLHWVTLGGQYDWTNRIYPGEEPPQFPGDLARFLETLFPATRAQAAIVNFYTPGDTMMMHRDVSEETDKGLVSLSFGCDGLFMITPNDMGKAEEREGEAAVGETPEKPYLLLRIRSGDAIYMTEESRYAWHGVPKVLKGTCPDFLADWPAEDGEYEEWRGWMRNKRINLNVRQMRD